MILTDPTGLIIETQGDARVIDAGRAVHLEHGGRWSEADIGTNAIGAAMAEARPVQIHGAEHFCTEVQRWTCAAVPVHDPSEGELVGVVDISGPASTFNPQSLALAVAVGHQVESFLARHPEFAIVPPEETVSVLWDKAEAFAQAALRFPEGWLMTPRRTGTDGFFVSILKRKTA